MRKPSLTSQKQKMAMKTAVMAAIKQPRGLNRLFTSSSSSSAFDFKPPQHLSTNHQQTADPSPNLFVSGLSKRTTTEGLHEAFTKFGQVVSANVVTDRASGFSKGYGFVRYSSIEDAKAGKDGMDGKFLDGWVIFADYAKPQSPPANRQQQNGNSAFGQNRY